MPAEKMLPTRDKFVDDTTSLTKRKRDKLKSTDGLLEDWQFKRAGWSASERLYCLELLLKEVRWWLDEHKTESDSDKRKKNVAALRQTIVEAMPYFEFEVRKHTARRTVPVAPGMDNSKYRLKEIGKAYAPEREQFVNQRNVMRGTGQYTPDARISPIAGTFVVEAHHDAALPALLGKHKENLTVADYQTYKANVPAGFEDEKKRVMFMRKAERLQHRMSFRNGLIYQNDQKVTTTATLTNGTVNRIAWMYAMDLYGNMFAVYERNSALPQRAEANAAMNLAAEAGRYNHSSLNAGRSVICAGTIKIEDGRLTYLSNLSGHYAPTADSLRECLLILRDEEGVDMTNVLVDVMVKDGGELDVPAPAFLNRMRAVVPARGTAPVNPLGMGRRG